MGNECWWKQWELNISGKQWREGALISCNTQLPPSAHNKALHCALGSSEKQQSAMFHCQVHWSSVPASAVPQLELTTAQRSPIPLNTVSLKITSSEIIASEQSTVKQKIHIWKEQCVLIRSIWAFVLSPTLALKTFQQHIEWLAWGGSSIWVWLP